MKISILFFFLASSTAVWSQNAMGITAAGKKALIDSVKMRLERYYVFPDKGKEMGQYLAIRWKSKAYNHISDYRAFVDTLAKDLEQVYKDPHLGLAYNQGLVQHIKENNSRPGPTPESLEREKIHYRKDNYGFRRVERLPGNIGYIELTSFSPINEESKTIVASAFEFIAYSNAIIIDLRNNNGGQPEMVQEVLGYFFDTPVHYSSIYDRILDKAVDYYALDTVKGRKIPNKKLYILTSQTSFSAGEAFAYYMKNLKRAVIIGEVTAGGAHPRKAFEVNDQVAIFVPFGREINPITKTDWEGVGVQSDVMVKADKALAKAQQMIMENTLASVSNPLEKAELEWGLVAIQAVLNPVTITEGLKRDYAGVYGERTIFLEGDHLVYQRGSGQKRKLTALTEDTFDVESLDFFRIKFVRNTNGKVEKMIGLYNDGNTNESIRTK